MGKKKCSKCKKAFNIVFGYKKLCSDCTAWKTKLFGGKR